MSQEVTRKYMTIKGFCKENSFISENGIRWMIHSNKEFTKRCVVRLGRKILLKPEEIFKYIEDQNE